MNNELVALFSSLWQHGWKLKNIALYLHKTRLRTRNNDRESTRLVDDIRSSQVLFTPSCMALSNDIFLVSFCSSPCSSFLCALCHWFSWQNGDINLSRTWHLLPRTYFVYLYLYLYQPTVQPTQQLIEPGWSRRLDGLAVASDRFQRLRVGRAGKRWIF